MFCRPKPSTPRQAGRPARSCISCWIEDEAGECIGCSLQLAPWKFDFIDMSFAAFWVNLQILCLSLPAVGSKTHLELLA